MGVIWNLVAHSHLVVTLGKGLLKLVKGTLHSNFGLIGLDRVMSFFGIN
ncbi:MAG: hypothetical protein WCP64_04140 [Actinomycetes bacterium]